MPRTSVDYTRTIIYKLVHKEDYDNANIYIGSTTDFIKRKCGHKTKCCNVNNQGYNEKKYQFIRNNGGWEQWNMIEVEKYSCNDGNEARAREEYWRCYFNANLNSRKAFTTKEERQEINKLNSKINYENNPDKYKEIQKKYRENNKDKISEYDKKYKEDNKDKINKYREENKDKANKYGKEYYEKNKHKIYEITTCICGCNFTKNNLNRHLKSKRHTDLMAVQELPHQQ